MPATRKLLELRLAELCRIGDIELRRDAQVRSLGFVEIPLEGRLVFAMNEKWLRDALATPGIAAILTTSDLADQVGREDVGLAVAAHPQRAFVDLHHRLAETTDFYGVPSPTRIDPGAEIHATAHVDDRDVTIGPGCRIGPKAVIACGTVLGRDVRVMAGAVLGGEGFQLMRFGESIADVRHVGGIEVGDGAVVMANAVVARAVFRQATSVGPQCRIGNAAFISHNVRLGARSCIGHGAIVAGNCRIGDDAVIGSGAVVLDRLDIGDRAHVTAGAVVMRPVTEGARVSGNFAIEHRRLLAAMARDSREVLP